MNLSIQVRLENEDGHFRQKDINLSLDDEAMLKDMAARTLLIQVPSLVEKIFDPEGEWTDPNPPKKKAPAKKAPAKKTATAEK